jgi:hypothetical protein
MKPRPDMRLLKGTLKSLLVTINGLEGLDFGQLNEDAREILVGFKNEMERHVGLQSNVTMQTFDAVFKAAGWDDQGFRWTTEKDSDHGVPEIWLVHFKDKHHNTWEIA